MCANCMSDMDAPELERLLKQVLPHTNPCNSKKALEDRAKKEMHYYLRLVHHRLTSNTAHASEVADNHARVSHLLACIDKTLSDH